MAYSDFTLNDIKQKLHLNIEEETSLFISVPDAAPSAWLVETLEQTQPLAIKIGTEKARSELIIAPIMVEFRNLTQHQISLFSGINFNVDPSRGLTGFCDFILSRSREQLSLNSPVFIVVEAKNENIIAGIPQCIATMFASRIFNERTGMLTPIVYGAVSTGTNWRFILLRDNKAYVDLDEYHISQINKLLGILRSIYDNTEPVAIGSSEVVQKAA